MADPEFLLEHARRVEHLAEMLASMNGTLDSYLKTRGLLNLRASGLLKLGDTVEVSPLENIPDPTSEHQVGNFGWGFHLAERYDGDVRVPITTSTLQRLPIEFTGIGISRLRDHRSRPAFYRSIALFPGFFVNLAETISDSDRPPQNLGPELFVAYSVMSRLIDAKDPGAIRPDGKIDRSYLFRPSPKVGKDHLKSVS